MCIGSGSAAQNTHKTARRASARGRAGSGAGSRLEFGLIVARGIRFRFSGLSRCLGSGSAGAQAQVQRVQQQHGSGSAGLQTCPRYAAHCGATRTVITDYVPPTPWEPGGVSAITWALGKATGMAEEGTVLPTTPPVRHQYTTTTTTTNNYCSRWGG
eukprot:gene9741-biopygen1605